MCNSQKFINPQFEIPYVLPNGAPVVASKERVGHQPQTFSKNNILFIIDLPVQGKESLFRDSVFIFLTLLKALSFSLSSVLYLAEAYAYILIARNVEIY